jgi:ferritin-like metal-binding protein YciE
VAIKDPKQAFVLILSNVRQNTERANTLYDEIGKQAQDDDVREILGSRKLISNQILERLDECFRLIGEKPVQLTGRLHDAFIEEFRQQVADIQSPVAKRLFVLAKIAQLIHLRVGEYVALTAVADMTGNYAVGALLESCLADKLALLERTRRLIRGIAKERIRERIAA